MNNKVNSVLNSIEKIDNLIMEADVSVSDAMSDVYSKQFKMEGNVTEDYINHEYYQESVIAGILIGGGIIAVLATAIVLITKHVKKSASGDPEKKNDTSTAAGVSLDKPEEFNKKVEQLKSELEKAGGKLTISDVGFDASKLKQKYEMIKELCGYAETFLKGTEDDEINGALTQFNDKLTEINGINYKLSGEVDVTPASLDEIKSLAGPIQQMTAELEKVSKEFEKRSKENKNANTGEMDDAKKERFEKLKEGLNQINKGSTDLGKSVDNEFSIIRKYFEAVSKAAKEKAKPAQAESEKKSESENSQETPQNTDLLKQKIGPIIDKWASTSSNSDPKHPGVKLTANEAYNIINDIYDNVINHRSSLAMGTLRARATKDPTKAMLIKNLIETTIEDQNVFETDERTINDIKAELSDLKKIALSVPSEEPKKDETKPESEKPKKGTNESGEKITISKDGGALYDLITSWSDIEKFKSALNGGNAIISGPINISYNNESLLTNTGKTKGNSTKFEITFGSEEEKRLISSFLNILDNFLNNEELFNKIPPELQKKLIGAFDMFLKRNEPLFPGNINLENNNFGWLDIKNSINKLKEKYAGSKETKSDETTNTPPVENKEGNTEQLSENEQKMQVAFEQLESKLEQIQQKYPNGLSTIGIATGCDPRTFSAIILTQFIKNKSEAEIKAFSNNLMDCLRGGFFRNKSQTHAKVNSQLPAPCKEAIDVMQIMINDGYEVGNSLMGTNYTPDNLSKYKGYMYKGNLINKLIKITPENVLTDDVFNDVKLGNPENTETPEEPSPEETTPEKDPETPVTNSRPKMEFALKNPGAAVDYVNQHPTSSDKSNEIPEDRKNKLIEAVDAGLSDVIIEYNNSIMIGIDFDEDELTRLDVSVLIMQAIIVLQINELRNDIGGFLKQFYAKYANDNSMSRRNTAFGLAKAYAKIKGLTVDIPSPEGKIITVTPSSDQTDTDKPEQEPPKNVIDKSSVDEYLDKLKNGSINKDSTAAADFAKKQKHLGSLGFNPPKIEEEKPDNEVDDTKSNVTSYESPYKSPDVMYDDTFTGNTNSDIETMLNNRMYGADKDEAQQITSDTIQNKLNRLNLGNDDTEETVSLEELKNLPSLMSDAVSGKLTDDGAKKLASNIMQLKLAIVWPTDVIEATNIDYATDITKKILSDCDTVSSSGDQNTIEQMKSDIVNVQKNPETEITSTPEEALNKIVDLTGKVTNLIKSAAVNGANNISVALNSTKRFVSEVVLPGMHAAASMGSNAATNTIEKAKSLVTIINNHLTGSITSSPISNDNTVQSATPSTENADTTKEPSTTRVKYDSDIMFMPAAPVNIFKNVPDLGSMDATQVLSELFNTFDYINKPTGSKYYRNHEDTDFTQGDLDFINSIRGQGGSLPLRKKSELASNSRTLVNYFNSIYSMLKTIGGNNAMNRYNPTSKKLVVDIATTLEQYLGYVQAELEESHKDVLNAATPMMNKVLDECERIKNIK